MNKVHLSGKVIAIDMVDFCAEVHIYGELDEKKMGLIKKALTVQGRKWEILKQVKKSNE